VPKRWMIDATHRETPPTIRSCREWPLPIMDMATRSDPAGRAPDVCPPWDRQSTSSSIQNPNGAGPGAAVRSEAPNAETGSPKLWRFGLRCEAYWEMRAESRCGLHRFTLVSDLIATGQSSTSRAGPVRPDGSPFAFAGPCTSFGAPRLGRSRRVREVPPSPGGNSVRHCRWRPFRLGPGHRETAPTLSPMARHALRWAFLIFVLDYGLLFFGAETGAIRHGGGHDWPRFRPSRLCLRY